MNQNIPSPPVKKTDHSPDKWQPIDNAKIYAVAKRGFIALPYNFLQVIRRRFLLNFLFEISYAKQWDYTGNNEITVVTMRLHW